MPFLRSLEETVSKYKGREWRASSAKDISEFASHPCAIFSDDSVSIFAKFSDSPDAAQQFEIELVSLNYLKTYAGVMIPTPIGIISMANGTLFVMEALDVIERGPLQWRQIGRALAQIHRIKSDSCGFHMNNYFGPLGQDNTPIRDWVTFFRERRLIPHLKLAVDSGNLPCSIALQVESLIKRLPELCGPETKPSLLHGDAQQNNFISTSQGAYVIDPAVYYGNPEIDLAFIDFFQSVPEEVFEGYREEMPIDIGFIERRNFWRVSGYLAVVAVGGQEYLNKLTSALQGYL